jgi:uncharacterized membrane protein
VPDTHPTDPLARLERVLAGILIVMTPVGLAIMLVPSLARDYLWTTTLYFGVQAALTFIITLRDATPARATLLFAGIVALSLTLEGIGVATGQPFGRYQYSTILAPLLFGIVPPAIGLAWYIITVSAWRLTRCAASTRADRGVWRGIALAAVLILGIDVLLEPFASTVNGFWIWTGGTAPWQNYAAWLVAGGAFAGMAQALLRGAVDPGRQAEASPARDNALPLLVLGGTVLPCVVINLSAGHAGQTVLGLALVIAPLLPRARRTA